MNATELHVRVRAKTIEAIHIASFELVPVDDQPLPAFTAGAHIDVHLPGGLTRPYSLCNNPAESHRYLIGVLREPGSRGGSAAMHEQVQPGQTLRISAPKNHFALAQQASHSLLLAGGIGVTPMLAMAEHLAATGASFEMHYCTRSVAHTAFRSRIAAAAFASRLQCHLDDGPASQKLQLDPLLDVVRPGVHLYVCGPQGFIDWVLTKARTAGWPDEQLHFEFFGAEPSKFDADSSFEVKLASSGQVVVVPRDMSVVQALAAAGVDLATSCEQGVCGTCLTRVVEGVPDHRDLFLTPAEQAANDQFLPCCSRARSPLLVLDL